MQQIDFIKREDQQARLRRLLEQAAQRVGVAELAHQLGEDPSTLVHQLRRDGSKRPSADLEALVWLLDPQYRHDKAAVTGELLTRPADLTPEETLRDLSARSIAQGFVSRQDVHDLLARTRMPLRAVAGEG